MTGRIKKPKEGDSKPGKKQLEKLLQEAEFTDRQLEEDRVANVYQPGRIQERPEGELGKRIQEAREAKRLTQGELAELMKSLDPDEKGVSRAVISLYEAGTNRPSPREIRLLCEALRVTPNFLIYGDEEPFHALNDHHRLGSRARRDPEGFAWMAYVFATLHHNHFDSLMSLALDLQRGMNASFDQGLQAKANESLLEMAKELEQLLQKRKAL